MSDVMQYLICRNDLRSQSLLLTSSQNEVALPGLLELAAPTKQFKGNSFWENLELYLVRIFYLFMLP